MERSGTTDLYESCTYIKVRVI